MKRAMELSELMPSAVERLLASSGQLPSMVWGDQGSADIQRDASALWIDTAGAGSISYQDFVDRLLGLPPESLLPYGLGGDGEIVQFASALWDLKYGPLPSEVEGCGDLERALYGRAPSHALFHEHCIDHATHVGPQGRGTVSVDTRAQLTMTYGEFQRLLSGIGPGADSSGQQRMRPAQPWAGAPDGEIEGRREETPMRREEVLIDLDVPARLGLRVTASEWYPYERERERERGRERA